MDGDELLRPSDLSRALGVSRGRIYQLIAARRLPAVRIGRSLRIPRGAWERWLGDQRDRALAAVRAPDDSPGRRGP
jgi:excisionase family DNA binding protein